MAISFINQAAAAATSVSIPSSWAAGDVALLFAHRDGNNTAPSLPAGWTDLISAGGNSNSARTGYRILQAGDTDSGTWTNATSVLMSVYRGVSLPGVVAENGSSGSTVTVPALSGMSAAGTSWVVGFVGHRTATDVDDLVVTGMTNRSGANGTTDIGVADTNGGVSSWSAQDDTVNASASWRGHAIELLAAATQRRILLMGTG